MAIATAKIRITVGPPSACEELGRVTRNFVSGYNRSRVHYGQLYGNERRCLVTNFNGAIPVGRRIVRAVWETLDTVSLRMSEPRIEANGRETCVTLDAQWAGRTRIKVDAHLDNGEIYSAWHAFRVMPAPYVGTQQWVSGPKRLEAVE